MITNKLNNLKNRDKGFTIIEILIVLAIAGLILLIVFLAVPALQRNTRNTARKSDAGHIASSVNDYISNNNGIIPVIGNAAGEWGGGVCASILSDAGTLSQYNTTANPLNCTSAVAGDMTSASFHIATAPTHAGGLVANTTPDTTAVVLSTAHDALLYVEGATCSTNNGTNVTLAVGTDSQSVLVYTLESGSTDYNEACTQVE